MSLDEQIERTEQEYKAYSEANFANPEIILWLKSVLESLYTFKESYMKWYDWLPIYGMITSVYKKVKEWADNEPTVFLEVIKPEL